MLNDQLQVVDGGSIKDKYNVLEFDDLDKALAQKPDIVFITLVEKSLAAIDPYIFGLIV